MLSQIDRIKKYQKEKGETIREDSFIQDFEHLPKCIKCNIEVDHITETLCKYCKRGQDEY